MLHLPKLKLSSTIITPKLVLSYPSEVSTKTGRTHTQCSGLHRHCLFFYLVGLLAFVFSTNTRITEKANDIICAMVRRNITSNGSSGVHPINLIVNRKKIGLNSILNIPAVLHLSTILFSPPCKRIRCYS